MKIAFATVVIAIVVTPNAVRAQEADFFAGKQISLLIGTTAGGGYDAYGRLLARHIGRHIPGNPSIVAKNQPQNGVPFEKLFHMLSPAGKAALFDSTKFSWLGSMTQTVFVTVTWHESPTKTLKDAIARETTLGASGTSADSYVLAMLSNNLLGTKFKVVVGYAGATQVSLAVENGEVEGEAGKDWTTLTSTKPQWIRDKKVNIIVQMGMRPHPDIKGVPMAIELAKSADDRRIMEVVFAKFGMSRPFFAPPGLPPERLDILRRAFDATLKDPALLVEAKKLGIEINPVTGGDVEALVARMMSTPDALAQRARDALKPPKQ
jgi:tripartite-type tricarboxylate transporter receptor subunit TctC